MSTTSSASSRWKIAAAAGAGAALAAVAVIAMSRGSDGPAEAVPPSTSVGAESTVPTSTEGGSSGDGTITVSGHGTVQVVPDVADIATGVQAQAETAGEAMDTVGAASQRLIDTLKGLGLADEDIQTSGLSLYPSYGRDGTAITGYQASTNVNATIRDVGRVGEVLDALKGLVGEQLTLGGISFSYDDPEAVLAEARTNAVANARTRAEQYADAAGVELGPIVRIVEGTVPSDVFRAAVPEAADMAAASVAVAPGSQDLAADVTVVFEMA
ncbi:MAG: SIMPL domain-containing protein [Ilumatobacteraceae bacterium]